MQVAYDARPLIEKGTGIGRYVRCLLEALLGFEEMREFLLCSPREIAAGDVLARDSRVRELVQKGWKGNVWLQMVVPFLLAKHKPDLFHGTLFLPPFLARPPSVVNIYDLTMYRYPGTMEAKNKWPLKILLPRAVSRADRIITLSEFTKLEIGERWPEAMQKIQVVPGAPHLSFDALSGASSAADPEKVLARYGVRSGYLLYVGTMEPRKNIVRLLRAFERLNEMGEKGTQLVLVGHEGWGLREVREAWESSPVRSSIRYIGYVPDEVLGLFYRHAEIFVFLSCTRDSDFPPSRRWRLGPVSWPPTGPACPSASEKQACRRTPWMSRPWRRPFFNCSETETFEKSMWRRGSTGEELQLAEERRKDPAVYREFS